MSSRYLVSVGELAVILGKSKWTVNRMVTEGRLPFQPVEGLGTRAFRRVDVESYVGQAIDLEQVAS